MIICKKGEGCTIEGTGEELMNDFGNVISSMTDALQSEIGFTETKHLLLAFTAFVIDKSKSEKTDAEIVLEAIMKAIEKGE